MRMRFEGKLSYRRAKYFSRYKPDYGRSISQDVVSVDTYVYDVINLLQKEVCALHKLILKLTFTNILHILLKKPEKQLQQNFNF